MVTEVQLSEIIKAVNHGSWYKDFLPIISAITGVVIGLFLNSFKEILISKAKKKRYKLLIEQEILLAIEEAIDLAKRLSNQLDECMDKQKPIHLYVYDISCICFEKFYPDIIDSYESKERQLIHSIYSQISFINSFASKSITSPIGKEYSASFNKGNDIFISIVKLYQAYINFYLKKDMKEISIEYFLKENEIKSEFYTGMINKSRAERKAGKLVD